MALFRIFRRKQSNSSKEDNNGGGGGGGGKRKESSSKLNNFVWNLNKDDLRSVVTKILLCYIHLVYFYLTVMNFVTNERQL